MAVKRRRVPYGRPGCCNLIPAIKSDMLAGFRMTSMKQLLAGLTLASITLVTAAALVRPQAHASAALPETQRTPVIIELFTSEGCSGYPPANGLLAGLAE